MNTLSDEPGQKTSGCRMQGETILVLDDDQNIRSFIGSALERLGYRFLEAADVSTAMLILEEEEGANVDLLLLDVALPGDVGGPELAVRAREQFAVETKAVSRALIDPDSGKSPLPCSCQIIPCCHE